jgi:DNA-directed RNA polymerase specialized sigma24 family protein
MIGKMRDGDPSDSELLAEWLHRRRERAFQHLVERYAGLVHMAARRTCGDEEASAKISQAVFILLARKAGNLVSRKSLAGWLHLTAVMQAKNHLRKSRREFRKRELIQADMETNPAPESAEIWKEMQPIHDEAISS